MQWRDNQIILSVTNTCCNHPLAVTLLGGTRLQSMEEWKDALTVIKSDLSESQELLQAIPSYLYRVLQYAMSRLSDPIKAYFHFLAAFKRNTNIPLTAIATLWNQPTEMHSILTDLHNRSLLIYYDYQDDSRYLEIKLKKLIYVRID